MSNPRNDDDLGEIIEALYGIWFAGENEERVFVPYQPKRREPLDLKGLPPTLAEEYVKSQIALNKAEVSRLNFDLKESKKYAREEDATADTARLYNFYDDVRETSVKKCIAQLDVWSRRDPGEPITIQFTSPGGSVFDGLALFDFIKGLSAQGTHVTTVAYGMAASMGGILLQAGDNRVMGANGWLMIHEISAFNVGKASELEDEVKLIKRLQDRALDILSERSTMKKAEIARKWKRKDWWLTAEEAFELGFCDEVR